MRFKHRFFQPGSFSLANILSRTVLYFGILSFMTLICPFMEIKRLGGLSGMLDDLAFNM